MFTYPLAREELSTTEFLELTRLLHDDALRSNVPIGLVGAPIPSRWWVQVTRTSVLLHRDGVKSTWRIDIGVAGRSKPLPWEIEPRQSPHLVDTGLLPPEVSLDLEH